MTTRPIRSDVGAASRAARGRRRVGRPITRNGFTLFELILAIALSATLLALIGMAINLYLMRVDASRTRVEEAQLARSVLATIAADIRATTFYMPQDMSVIAQLLENAAEFDVDSIDDPTEGGGGEGGGGGQGGGSFSGSGDSSSSGAGATSQPSSTAAASDAVLPVGLNGNFVELIVDVSRLPRLDELFQPQRPTGYLNVAAVPPPSVPPMVIPRPSDVKTVRYFIRDGQQIDPGSLAATSLAPAAQLQAGGLVRQEIDRATRSWAELSGNEAVLESGQTLLAPEVVQIELRYFDGSTVVDYWDMRERSTLPMAVEVRIWLLSQEELQRHGDAVSAIRNPLAFAREYRQTVYLPLAALAASSFAASASSADSTGAAGTAGAAGATQ